MSTATGGSGTNSIAVTGTGPWTVTVSGVTLDQGAAQTLPAELRRHERRRSRGPQRLQRPAHVVWTTKQRSSSRGTLDQSRRCSRRSPSTRPMAQAPSHRASRPSPAPRPALTETLTYTAPAGGLSNGTLTVAVPAGWTAPATSAGPGFTTSSVGAVSVAGQTITVSGVTRTAAQTVVITYGPARRQLHRQRPGAQTWLVREASTAGGALTSIAASPTITIYAPDASGLRPRRRRMFPHRRSATRLSSRTPPPRETC